MLVIVDYKMGNLGSIANMLKKIGHSSVISSDIETIVKAEKIILPGVGAFDKAMENLSNLNLIETLNKKALVDKVPVLGICLGMQLLANRSEEGILPGLSWINGNIIKFKIENNLRVPHMGWNLVHKNKEHPLFQGMNETPRFYFVHSYHFSCSDSADVLATTNYGYDFTSVVCRNNIAGVQFHPEKSHRFGMQLLKNFIELV